MHVFAPLLLGLLSAASTSSIASADAPPAPDEAARAPSLLEAVAATAEGPARFRVQPGPGAFLGLADVTEDGLQDVVVIASRGRGAWLLPGDGKGGLGPMRMLDRSIGPHGVGDLDGDGAPEQLYGGAFDSEAVVLSGKLGAPQPALRADFDGDGRADLARVEDCALRVAFVKDARETRVQVSADAVSLAAADLDGDGAVDLLVADARRDEIAVLRGDARGGFRPAGGYRVWLRPFSMAAGDLDGDGAVDVVASDQCGSTLALLRGDGRGGFADPILLQSSGPVAPEAADLPAGPAVKSVVLVPSSLPRRSGTASLVTVTLDGPAPPEGRVVRLRSSDPELVSLAAEVTVPAGETRVTFPVEPSESARRSGRLAYLATIGAAAQDGKPASATLTVTGD
jgi:hypothetical protein